MTPYGRRTRTLPAPPHVVWDDLAAPRTTGVRAWFEPRDDETAPVVLSGTRPTDLVWSSIWTDRPDDEVHFELARTGSDSGTRLTFTLLAPRDLPDEATVGRIRYRTNQLLWADLRYAYGQ